MSHSDPCFSTEKYADNAAIDAHMNSDHFKALGPVIGEVGQIVELKGLIRFDQAPDEDLFPLHTTVACRSSRHVHHRHCCPLKRLCFLRHVIRADLSREITRSQLNCKLAGVLEPNTLRPISFICDVVCFSFSSE